MIYLFNESKTLFSIVSREELLSFLYEREVNALYQASVEMPVQSTDKNGLTRNLYNEMQNATYFGHYDLNDKFQLHKIVSIDVTGDSFITTAVHLFFDEAKALAVTEERRFIDRPIEDSVIYAFGLIGWTLDEYDISDAKTVSFFNDTVLEAQAKIIKTFGFKFDYWLDFDGQKITSKKVKVKEELGTQTHQRYVYGHNTLGIKMETDFSEIYTAVLGRGHGERIENLDDEGNETEDTFGRRIEFDEVEWSISSGDPLDKDLGERILVDPVSTQIFGYVREDDTVAPRVKVVEFSDIEDKEDLLQASYDWLMENNSPKAVYSVEVLETEELDLGDEVYVVYRDIDFVKSARVSRVVDDLLTDRRAVEFGDSDYFRRNSETSRLQRELQDTKNDSADYIQDLKRQANERIDQEMQQARDDFDQALIVAHVEIQAAEQRMADLIGGVRDDFDTDFNAEIERIEQEALAEYERISGEITSSIDQARTEIEEDYNQAVTNAREYADTQIANKEQQYVEDWDIRDAEIQSTIEQIVGGSVDSLDSSLLEINNKLLDKLEIGDISDLYADVDTISDTLNTAREDLDTARDDLVTTRADLDTARADLDATRDDLDTARDDLQQQLDDAKAELEGIEVGVRNWFAKSKVILSNNLRYDDQLDLYYNVNANNSFSIFRMSSFGLELNQQYILAYEIKSNSPELELRTNTYINGSVSSVDNNSPELIEGEWVKVYTEPFLYHTENTGSVHIYFNHLENARDFEIRNFQINRGTILQDWTPAPEDAEAKITTLEQDIQYIDGELSAKLTQTDIEPYVNRISQAETDISASATNITLLQNKTTSIDGEIIRWGNLTQSTADEVSSVLSRVSATEEGIDEAKSEISATADGLNALVTRTTNVEGDITQAQADISATADELSAVVTRTSNVEGKIESAETNITTQAGRIDAVLARTESTESGLTQAQADISANADGLSALITRTTDVEGDISQAQTDISATADGLSALVTRTEATEGGLSQAQTAISANADAITARVTRTEFDELVYENRNLLLNSDFKNGSNDWTIFYDRNAIFTENYVLLNNESPTEENGFYQSVFTPRGNIVRDDDEDVTVSVWIQGSGVLFVEFGNTSGQGYVIDHVPFSSDDIIKISGSVSNTGNGNLIFGLMGEGSAVIHHVKLEKGTIATDWTPSPRDTDAKVTQLATELTIEAGLIEATMTRVGEAETAIGTIQASVDGFRSEVANIDTWHYNLLRGTRFDEDRWDAFYGEILTDEDVNYFRFVESATSASVPYVQINTPYQFKAGETYTLSWDFQSFGVTVFDYVWLIATDEDGGGNISIHHSSNHDESDLTVTLGAEYRRYWIRFTPRRDIEAYVRVGANLNNNPLGRSSFKLRLPYLTTANRSQWLYHQLDNSQNMEEVVSRVSSLEQTSDSITSQVGVMHGLVEDIETWRLDRGTIIDQTADAISAKVWQSDIDDLEISARNLIPKSDIYNHTSEWNTWGSNTTLSPSTNEQLDGYVWVYRNNATSGTQLGAITPILTKDLIAGVPYTIRFKTTHFRDTNPLVDYMYFMYENHSNEGIRYQDVDVKYFRTNVYSDEWIYQVTAIPSHSGQARIMFGTTGTRQDRGQISFYIKEPMVVEGTKVIGDYQTAPEDSLLITDFILRSDGFLLGGKYVGGEHYSTAIIGDANGLKLLGDTIIDGNLYVKETIESYAIDAVEANIGSLFANTANIDFITAKHINTNAVEAEHLRINNALITKLSASTIFTNMLSTKTLDAIDANIGSVRTSLLTANVITSGMIQSSNATINKLFSNNARIDTLVSKTHFVDEIKTMSISAVNADIANIRSKILTSDVIKSTHLSASNFMVDKLFGTTALIERLTSKTAFINSIKAIDIDVVKITGNTSNFVQSNWNSINSSLEVTGTRLRYTHSDGSYTQMSASGLRKFDNNTWYTTHYLMDSVNVTVNTGGATDVVWVQLPNVYKGKQFKIFLSATDIYGAVQEGDYYYNHLTLKRFVLIKSPDHDIDYTNARVPIRGYAHYVDDRDKSRNNIFYPLQGVLTVIY